MLSEHVEKEPQSLTGLELEKEEAGRRELVKDMDWEEITSNKIHNIETTAKS